MVQKDRYRLVKIAESIAEFDFPENNLIEIITEDKSICLIKTSTGLKACAAKCPHAGGKMAHGKLDLKGNIVCCVHDYHFSLIHGRDSFNEGYFLKIYPVITNKEGIFIGL
ncbi:MAG: Rieske 2Fe-2S domain-containing protein [Ginsengibacter sp.]|jgi:3-phenylpropionate/trans-cinnamate dioxygenase ferredoxin subunit